MSLTRKLLTPELLARQKRINKYGNGFNNGDIDFNEGENVISPKEKTDIENKENTVSVNELDKKSDADSLFEFEPMKRRAELPEGQYKAVIQEICAEEKLGIYGKFISIKIKFNIKYNENEIFINLLTSKDSKPSGKLFQTLKMILGEEPSAGFDLRTLKGQEVLVDVGHRIDKYGNTWEDVLKAEKIQI